MTHSLRPATGSTRVLGLLGDPVAHSLSPRLHEAFIGWAGVDVRYVPFRVASGDLARALDGLAALGVAGVNLTVPHKISGARWVDELEGVANEIGAINAVRWTGEGRSIGFNTDVEGLQRALRSSSDAASGPVMVLGAGGAARAAVMALSGLGCGPIHVLARRIDASSELVADLGGVAGPLTEEGIRAAGEVAWIINATSCGVGSQAEISPWPTGAPWPCDARVMDLVYGETPFQREAKAAGRHTLDGMGMLAWQGAIAFSRWMDLPIPPDHVIADICRKLRGKA